MSNAKKIPDFDENDGVSLKAEQFIDQLNQLLSEESDYPKALLFISDELQELLLTYQNQSKLSQTGLSAPPAFF